MFAVIKTGGKQYRVVANDEFEIERLPGEAGDSVSFKDVLMVGTSIGAPFVAGASVTAEIVEQTRGPKVISFKKRRRQNSKRTRGHRQDLTLIRIGEILTDGKTASEKPKAEAAEPGSVKTAEAKAAETKIEDVRADETETTVAEAPAASEAPAKQKAPRKAKAAGSETAEAVPAAEPKE
ncbi:MAG: 50S ribosomal protein L21 [Rhizobiaceae bacterium]|nr:50S ribosomal protein L21 [Rhizobiaceae bacterium]